jgi:hypothetical protein
MRTPSSRREALSGGRSGCLPREPPISAIPLTGYTIVQAESHEAAAKLFENHPHFTLLPGNSIEIIECLDIPGM